MTPISFFLPLKVYFTKLFSSIHPRSHKTCSIPFSWPSQPSCILGVISTRSIYMFRHRRCNFFMFPVLFTPFSCSFHICSSFVYFLLISLFDITTSFHLAYLSTVSIQNRPSSVEQNTIFCTLPSFSLWVEWPKVSIYFFDK